jgi:hypothetical protein
MIISRIQPLTSGEQLIHLVDNLHFVESNSFFGVPLRQRRQILCHPRQRGPVFTIPTQATARCPL